MLKSIKLSRRHYAFGIFLLIIFLSIFISSRLKKSDSTQPDPAIPESSRIFNNIKERKELVVLTDYISVNYFVFRGQPMGFQYEMVKNYANFLGVDFRIEVSNSLEESFKLLSNEEVDLIAMDLTVTGERTSLCDFVLPHGQTRQVLVQRNSDIKKGNKEPVIRNLTQLAGKTVYVPSYSAFNYRLNNLSLEIGQKINVVQSNKDMEELLELVASGEIDYTVCDEHIVNVNKSRLPNLDFETYISFQQNYAWAVKKGADSLLQSLNIWMNGFKESAFYSAIKSKYFVSKSTLFYNNPDFNSGKGGQISPYDKYMKKYAPEIGWDWRLLASLIYQESKFKTDLVSWAGARGLMQFMPETAARYGISDASTPEQQIFAGVRYLEFLQSKFKNDKSKPEDIAKFVLAAYNLGPGHVIDARALAEKYDGDKYTWENSVDSFLCLKSKPKYYHDPVVRNGFCRGVETVKFVDAIFQRYEHYKNVVKE